jgi:inorganic triphosphatase YgiF
MSDLREVEIKLELPLQALRQIERSSRLRQPATKSETMHLTSVYFETRGCKLWRNGVSLRVRFDGQTYTQTIKTSNGRGTFDRKEWEQKISGPGPDINLARGTALKPFISKKLKQKPRPVFETKVKRKLFPLQAAGSVIDFTIDTGKVDTGKKSASICELEIELKDGDQAALFALANDLSKSAPVRLAVRSKAERGYDLIKSGLKPSLAVPLENMSVADAFQVIASACLWEIGANQEAASRGEAEGIHDMRVGLRRLRSAISVFSSILPDVQTRQLKQELKWLTDELGATRQLDVFKERVIEPLSGRHSREKAMRAFSIDVAERRDDAAEEARCAVEAGRGRRLLIQTLAWIETGAWLTNDDELVRARRERPIAKCAAE